MRTMELVRELFNELTLVHADQLQSVVENQSLLKQVRSSMDGLLKVLIWRLDNSISPSEFRQIYHEWLNKKGVLDQPLATATFFKNQTVPLGKDIANNDSYFMLFKRICKDLCSTEVQNLANKMGAIDVKEVILKMLDILHSEFNFLLTSGKVVGFDAYGEPIESVSH